MIWAKLRGFYRSRSISFRLYLIIILTTIIAISVAGYLGDRVAARLADSAVEANTARVAVGLAGTLSRDDILRDQEDLRRTVNDLLEANDFIARIDVYELTGNSIVRLITTSNANVRSLTVDEMTAAHQSRLLLVPEFKDRERFLKVIAPISIAGGGAGAVSVTSSLLWSDLMGQVHYRIALFLIPGTVLLLVLMLHYSFTRVMTRRIGHLMGAMTHARNGDLGRRVAPGANDELGKIARGFNEMMQEFERASLERDRLLEEQKGFNQQLQDRVTEATGDLSAANERLRQLNQDLLETQRRLTHLERKAVAGQMAATFAHEIGSPISAISTQLQLMLEDDRTSSNARNRLQLIQDQVDRITGFVEEMLAEARVATQVRSPVQVNRILTQLLLFLEQHLLRCRVQVETRFDPDLPEIEANAQQLQQVFLNLFNNACDAMPNGGSLTVTTHVESDAGGNRYVMIGVSDNGVGIPDEKQQRIFEPFFSTKELQGGTGLGLTIANRIVRQYGGTITLESSVGKGSAFTIRFPAAVTRSDANGAVAEGSEPIERKGAIADRG